MRSAYADWLARQPTDDRWVAWHNEGVAAGFTGGLAPQTNVHDVAQPDRAEPGRHTIPWYTGQEVAATTSAEPDWLLHGFIAREAITELDGKIKRAGKSTLMAHACDAIAAGRPFLDLPTTRTSIVYVTEQQRGPWRETISSSGLLERGEEFRTVFRADLTGLSWPAAVSELTDRCLEGGYGLLVIDTLGKLARLENENDNSEWTRAMEPLQNAAHRGLGVVVVRHERKSGGEVGESGRGGSAASGDVDIIMRLRRPEGRQPGNRRVIETLGRYRDTPEELVIELDVAAGDYRVLGDQDAVALADCAKALRAADVVGQKRNERELIELVGVPRTTVHRALRIGIEEGWVTRSGEGKRGSPYEYLTAPEIISAQPSLSVGVRAETALAQQAEANFADLGALRERYSPS